MVSEWVGDKSLRFLLREFNRKAALSLVSVIALHRTSVLC